MISYNIALIIQKYEWINQRDEPAVNDDGNIVNFNVANVTDFFHFKVKITSQNDNNCTKKYWNMVPFLNNSWNTANCITAYISVANLGATFAIADSTPYEPVVTFST